MRDSVMTLGTVRMSRPWWIPWHLHITDDRRLAFDHPVPVSLSHV